MHLLRILLVAILNVVVSEGGFACSGYKLTIGDKTILGANEDAWRVTPHIWFEKAKDKDQYGAAFTGSRHDGKNGYAPQSGMNEMGLAFERLSSFHPIQESVANRKKISNPTRYLKDILHSCKSIEEVKAYISQHDHSYFIEDVFLYVDRTGKYLIVEPYTLKTGNDPSYVISNFCPSLTSLENANKLDRYRNGAAYIKNGFETSLSFCKALSDTMHVCRNKIGDGTLLSSIWDLKNGIVNLYFYHDYSTTVQFNLGDELKKGDHIFAIDKLFPPNPEFQQLRNFKTPKNSLLLGVFIVSSAVFFLFSSIFFLIYYFRKKENTKYASVQLLLFPIGLILFYYMVVLSGSITVFYFPAPYKDPTNVFRSLTSYLPFLILILTVPFVVVNYKLIKERSWGWIATGLFTLNTLIYTILIVLFAYWRFYDFSS